MIPSTSGELGETLRGCPLPDLRKAIRAALPETIAPILPPLVPGGLFRGRTREKAAGAGRGTRHADSALEAQATTTAARLISS